MSQCGHFASIYAHLVLICGHVASVCGHFASVYGSFAPLSRCCASPCGHFMSLCRHFVSPCGHFVPVTHTSFQCDISGLIHVFVFSFHLSFKKKGMLLRCSFSSFRNDCFLFAGQTAAITQNFYCGNNMEKLGTLFNKGSCMQS